MHKKSHRKAIIAISIIAAVLVLGGAAFFVYNTLFKGTQSNTPVAESAQGVSETDTAIALAGQGKTAEAVDGLDKAIAESSSNEEKANYYTNKASILSSSDVPAAIEAAKQAAELSPTYGHYAFVAQLYESAGSTAAAIEYYQKTVEAYDKADANSDERTYSKQYYVNKIEKLRQS
jgi:tetratricopeptide (TPR) repeat protein